MKQEKRDSSKKKILNVYNGFECDSAEEIYFLYWAEELKDRGYIKTIKRGIPISLTYGLKVNQHTGKKKTTIKEKTLIRPSVYTPDFVLEFTEKGSKMVYTVSEIYRDTLFIGRNVGSSYIVHIEIKPIFNMQNMTRVFAMNQKFLFDKYGIYANLVKVPEIFKTTFLPKKYMLTPTGKNKKINFKYILIDEYLKQIEQ